MQRRKHAGYNAAHGRGMRDPDNISALDAISGSSTRISLRLNRYLLQRSRLKAKAAENRRLLQTSLALYRVDSISNPQASRSGSGMYLEFLLRRAHSRRRVDRRDWSGVSFNSFTACSNDVTIGITGPMGSGLPQLGLPRLFAIINLLLAFSGDKSNQLT